MYSAVSQKDSKLHKTYSSPYRYFVVSLVLYLNIIAKTSRMAKLMKLVAYFVKGYQATGDISGPR